MKAWEILKLLEEGNILENNLYELHWTCNVVYFFCKKNNTFDCEINLSMFKQEQDWQIKRESIPFEKALECMRQGRVCESDIYYFKISNGKLFYSYKENLYDFRKDDITWQEDETPYNQHVDYEWYLLPEEK